jgi:hypothetical protein
MALPQFFARQSFSPHPRAPFGRFNARDGRKGRRGKERKMEAASGRSRVRLMVVDFLATLFATFCIGVATALVLGFCVVLMAGEAQGAAPAKPRAAAAPVASPSTADLMLAHYFTAKYAGLVAIDRIHAAYPEREETARAAQPKRCKG